MTKNNLELLYKVSVIIPCFRCSKTIERAVTSVINQTFSAYEILLIEDSSDDSARTINKLKKIKSQFGSNIKIFSNKQNMGPGFSRNVGWEKSKGNLIAFLDADDAWHSKKLEIQCEFLKNSPDIDALCNYDEYNLDYKDQKINLKNNGRVEKLNLHKMLFKNSVSTRSVLIKKSINIRFNPYLRYSEDYSLWLDLLSKGKKIVKIPYCLSGYYKSSFSNEGLSSHLLEFFLSELKVINSQSSNSAKKITIKYIALIFCTLKFLKRCFFYLAYVLRRSYLET